MGVVFNLKSGQDYPPEKYSNIQKGTLYLTGASNLDGERIIENRWTETPSVIAPYGSLLLVCKGSGVGKMCFMSLPQAHIARQLQAIIPFTNDIDVRYVRYVLESRLREITKQANGVIPGISRDAALTFLLPVPPYNEQKRIIETMLYLSPMVERFGEQYDKLELLNKQITVQLKKSILQQAIQGHLVSQNPNDGCADDLLSQIDQEKRNLLKAGRLKKQDLSFSKIFKGDDNKYYESVSGKVKDISEEITFDIPDSWRWSRIKTLFQTTSGGTPEKGHPEYYGGDIPWVKVGDLTSLYLSKASETISKLGLENSSAKVFPAGTILVAMYCNDAIGKSTILSSPMATNQAICGLLPNNQLYKEYVYYAIQFNRGRLQEQAAGGAQKNINQKIVNELLIPIPPYKEQIRIVQRIHELYAHL